MASSAATGDEAFRGDGESRLVASGEARDQAQDREIGSVADQAQAPSVKGEGSAHGETQRAPTEWRCDCGKWVPIGYSRHSHVTQSEQSLDDLIRQRRLMEAGITKGVDLEPGEAWHTMRTNKHPTR